MHLGGRGCARVGAVARRAKDRPQSRVGLHPVAFRDQPPDPLRLHHGDLPAPWHHRFKAHQRQNDHPRLGPGKIAGRIQPDRQPPLMCHAVQKPLQLGMADALCVLRLSEGHAECLDPGPRRLNRFSDQPQFVAATNARKRVRHLKQFDTVADRAKWRDQIVTQTRAHQFRQHAGRNLHCFGIHRRVPCAVIE